MVQGGFEFAAEAEAALKAFGSRKLKWAVLRIPEGRDAGCELVASAESSGEGEEPSEADFAAFKAQLPADQPRWGIYDLNFMKNGVNNTKVCFVMYVPDDCTKNNLKFAYANHKETVKSKLQVNKELQINDIDDVTRAKFIDEF